MNAQIAVRPCLSLAEQLADLAVEALIDEAELSPKPALVDRRGSGAHHDLSLELMHASAWSLWSAFHAMAASGQAAGQVGLALRETLGRLGREGEAQMLAVTGGVNTHRGAIWALGLLVTAAAQEEQLVPSAVTLRAARLARLEDRHVPVRAPSNGERVRQRYGVGGARAEAQAGFPGALHHGLPQLQRSRAAGAGENHARLDALLAIMAQLDDTCVLHRAGPAGLACMQEGSRAVLEAGGSASLAGRRRLKDLECHLLRLNASPGGAADLLAVTLFLDRLEPQLRAQIGSL